MKIKEIIDKITKKRTVHSGSKLFNKGPTVITGTIASDKFLIEKANPYAVPIKCGGDYIAIAGRKTIVNKDKYKP